MKCWLNGLGSIPGNDFLPFNHVHTDSVAHAVSILMQGTEESHVDLLYFSVQLWLDRLILSVQVSVRLQTERNVIVDGSYYTESLRFTNNSLKNFLSTRFKSEYFFFTDV